MLVTNPVGAPCIVPLRGTYYPQLSTSTVSELPFVYVQWSQAVMLFPVIEACKFIALQTPFTFMQQARRGPALTRIVKDQRDAFANLGQRHRRRPFFSPDV